MSSSQADTCHNHSFMKTYSYNALQYSYILSLWWGNAWLVDKIEPVQYDTALARTM